MQSLIQEFMGHEEVKKRIKNMVTGTARETRLNVSIDELHRYDSRLSEFVKRSPLEAIRMFEELLNLSARDFTEEKGNLKH
mmetsp:Transcript_47771/g.35022  ORF Transcript_47771/g.35022 Transcript_47771/m.35022 type:complete len:81 (-) Transcript_47771:978-1220(-)